MVRSLYLAAAAGLALLAGCDLPVSVHPLSDEETSRLDERLIGQWELSALGDRAPEPDEPLPRYAFGRVKDKPNVLESVFLELDGEGHVQVRRVNLYATRLGELSYLSVPDSGPSVDEKPVYTILHYELAGENELRMYVLNKDVIGPAIEREDLAGEVEKSDPNPNAPVPEVVKPKYSKVKITAQPKELASYLARRGKAAFYTNEYFTLRRIELK